MRTSKPIAGISYNSDEFLLGKLEELRKQGKIEFACFINHKAEEGEKKDHKHLYIEPAKLIQTLDIEDFMKEFDPEHPDKPLGCVQLKVSKFDDWYMYCLHDQRYLHEKGLERVYSYDPSDFICTDRDAMNILVGNVRDARKGKLETRLYDLCAAGMQWGAVVSSGLVPINRMHGAKLYWDAIYPYTSPCTNNGLGPTPSFGDATEDSITDAGYTDNVVKFKKLPDDVAIPFK